MMEAYGIKYIATFESEVIGYNYEIRILERNYAGEVLLRNLGGAPELIKDNNGAICGTSLEFLLETKNDGDLREFYTEDNKKFKVEVWRENKLFWLGFVVTEVYSEAMVPVADISIRATDGLGLLKNEPYENIGKCQLLDIIKYCVDKSGLSLGFDFYTAIGFKGSRELGTFIQYGNEVNAEVLLEYKNCYDALVALLDTFALSITQSCARWVIRHQAIVEKCWRYNENALPDGHVEKNVIKIGRMGQEEATALPVNSLEMEIEPSRKNITLTEKQLTYPSLFGNWNFSTTRYWNGKGKYVTIGKEDCYFLPCIYKDFDAFNTVSQKIDKLNQTSNAVYLEIKYTVFTNRSDLEHQLWVYVYVEALNGTVYWLGKSGWKTGNVIQEELLFFTVSDLTTQFGEVKWNNLKIYVDGFPVYGDLTIKIYNIKSGVEINSANVGLYISEVRLMYEIPGEIEKSIQLSSTASQDEDFTLVFGDYAYGSDVKASMMGATGSVPNWVFIDSDEKMTFLDIMCQIWANIYFKARRKLSGTILLLSHTDGEFESDFIYLYDDRRYLCLSGSYNLLADEIDIELIEIDSLKPVIDNISFLSPRIADVAYSVFRASSGTEYRTYSNANNVSMQPHMIRDLKRVTDLNEDYLFEADNGSSSESEKVDFKAILNYLSDRYWTKEELACINGYLLYLNEKIKAGNSDLWEGHKFSDFLDQAVRKKDNVDFASLRSNEIRSDQFVAGALGEGFQLIKKDSSGKSYFEVDTLYARMKAVFSELEIRKMTYAGGNYVFSPAGMTCTNVIEMEDFYRCFFNADNGEKAVENLFKIDDLVQCRESNVKEGVYQQVKNNYYWRKCIAIGDNYIDLSKTDCSLNSDIPQVGDVMVVFGNKTDTTRQHVIVISVYGEGAPSFIQYAGIDDYSLEGKAKTIISPELNEFTGRLRFESGESVKSVISDSVKNGIDGIQIGGVNLFNNSKSIFLSGSDFPGITLREEGRIAITGNGTWNAYAGAPLDPSVLATKNKEFVVSVELYSNMDVTISTADQWWADGQWVVQNRIPISIKGGGVWSRYSYVVKTPDSNAISNFLISFSGTDNINLNLEYRNFMMEAGNKASASWSPSIADQQNQIDDAKNTANAAQQSVMQVTEQVTQLIADNNGIKASVKTVEEKVDNARQGIVNYLNDSRFDTLSGWYPTGGTVELVQDEKFGPVVEYSRSQEYGGYQKQFDLPREELTNTDLVYYVIAKQISNAETDIFYLGGWSETVYTLDSVVANKVDLGDGWYQYWTTFRSRDSIGAAFGLNSIAGTWRFYAAGVLKGNKPASWNPSLSDQESQMQNKADAAKSEAINTAAQDAQAKADAAKNEAVAYTDSRTEKIRYIDASGLDSNKYYPVGVCVFPTITSKITLETNLDYENGNPPWSTHQGGFSLLCVWTTNGSGWGTIAVNRNILEFAYRFASVLPAGNIGQVGTSNMEYIYVRGGGRYRFRIPPSVNDPVLHSDGYTGPAGEFLGILDSVTAPVPTLETVRVELQSQITVLQDQIDITVSRTEYDANNTSLRSDIGNLQVSYDNISATVTNVNNRLGTVETAGVTVTNFVRIFSEHKNELGESVIGSINVAPGNVKIEAKNINLNGTVTANGNVQITTDGKIIANSGMIGGLYFDNKVIGTEGHTTGGYIRISAKINEKPSIFISQDIPGQIITGSIQIGGRNDSNIINISNASVNVSKGGGTFSNGSDTVSICKNSALAITGETYFNGGIEIYGNTILRSIIKVPNLPERSGSGNWRTVVFNRNTGQLYWQ